MIDTGIEYTHPALGGCFGPGCKVAFGWDGQSRLLTPPQNPHDQS